MATSNFLVFNEVIDEFQTMNDSEYLSDTQRKKGVGSGIANRRVHNKLYRQTSIMAAAMAAFCVAQGYSATDDNVTTLQESLTQAIQHQINSSADFKGATAARPGTHGYVPAPPAGANNKLLTGEAEYKSLNDFILLQSGDIDYSKKNIKAATRDTGDSSLYVANTAFVSDAVENALTESKGLFFKSVSAKNDKLTFTRGDNTTSSVKVDKVNNASTANYLVTNEDGAIYHDLSKVSAGADVNLRINWSAKDNTRKILRYIFHDAKGTGDFADLQAKTVYAALSGNASSSNKLISERAKSGRPTSANIPTSADASIRYFLSTDSMRDSKPMTDGAIVQFGWDRSHFDSQLFIPNNDRGRLQWRAQSGSSNWSTSPQWKNLAWQDDLNNYLPLTGGTITGGMTFNGNVNVKNGITIPTRSRGDNTTYAASTAFVQDAITALINGSPGALDTLKELAAALGNDANFAATITKQLALKAPLASPSFTGTVTGPTPASEANNTQFATTAWVLSRISALATSPIIGDVSNANGWWVKIPCQGFNLLIQGVSFSLPETPSAKQELTLPVTAKIILFADTMVYDAAVDQIGFTSITENKLIVSKGNNDYFSRYGYVFAFSIQ